MNSLALCSPAQLPANYEAAKQALEACDRVDEVKAWADRSAAIATYARQSKDDSLVILAQKIQARAIRRLGELLNQVPAQKGVKHGQTRTAFARSNGVSSYGQAVAARVAAIPRAEFERQMESCKPPSITTLASMDHGRKRRAVGCCPTCGRPL